MHSPRYVITILGGSSVGTPVLIEALINAQASMLLPPIEIRLYGRSEKRLKGIVSYSKHLVKEFCNNHPNKEIDLKLEYDTSLKTLLPGSEIVLCQIRPGGMVGRQKDEELVNGLEVPADEGLGPCGLLNFLRSRQIMHKLVLSVKKYAPRALFFQMTSPLGLIVEFTRKITGMECYGVCELPMTTSKKVLNFVQPRLNVGLLYAKYAGLNHQSWIHSLTDKNGKEHIQNAISLITDPDMFSIDPAIINKEGAIPVKYLRLYYHKKQVIKEQRSNHASRAAYLEKWASELDRNYTKHVVDYNAIKYNLSKRNMNWYEEGVVPVICAFLGDRPAVISLNLPGKGALPGVDYNAVVELPCQVSKKSVNPVQVPSLPDGPSCLVNNLIAYEKAVLELREDFTRKEIAEVVGMHPFIENTMASESIANLIVSYDTPNIT